MVSVDNVLTRWDEEEIGEELRTPALHEMVYSQLYYAIASDKIKPGEYLNEKKIADRLCVSRSPVRRALMKLEQEGIICRQKGHAVVEEMHRREVETIYEIRMTIERLAALEVCACDGILNFYELKACNEDFAEAVRMKDLPRAVYADEKFHQVIYDISNNHILDTIYQELKQPIRAFRQKSCMHYLDSEMAIQEHLEIMDALERKDETRALQAVEHHVQAQKDGLLQHVNDYYRKDERKE